METTRTAGGVVLGFHADIALVKRRDGDGSWLFPKGHVDEGENDEEAARREIKEETGLTNLELLADLGTYERPRIKQDGTDHEEMKSIRMYLFSVTTSDTLSPTHEIAEAEWFPYRDVGSAIGNEKDRAWFATVFERVREAIQRD